MKANIIKIGNSKGIRIPKALIEESKIKKTVELKLHNGSIVISPVLEDVIDEGILMSYSALAKEWNTPEEDEAWASLQ